jgi:membrane protein DedA with SNARE-associated domain
MVLASLTSSVTSFIGDHGVYAVFVLMLLSAVIPAASEVVMLYAGAVAAGAFEGSEVVVFGHHFATGFDAYVAVAVAGVIGCWLGALIGWAIGAYGGRPFLERYGRWLHVSHQKLERAERWFDRFGSWTVLVGLSVPVVRSFVAIPAGILRLELRRFAPLALLGCIPFCFGLAAAGYALGSNWDSLHSVFRYVDWLVVAGAVLLAVYLVLRRRSSRLTSRA